MSTKQQLVPPVAADWAGGGGAQSWVGWEQGLYITTGSPFSHTRAFLGDTGKQTPGIGDKVHAWDLLQQSPKQNPLSLWAAALQAASPPAAPHIVCH